jgi:hypothetical protein
MDFLLGRRDTITIRSSSFLSLFLGDIMSNPQNRAEYYRYLANEHRRKMAVPPKLEAIIG